MSNIDNNTAKQSNYTNPLQNNTTIAMMIGYGAAVLASKFPLFDADTWNAIMLGAGGLAFTIYTAIATRKTNVVSTAANLPEVKKIELDNNVVGAHSLADVTPNNVVVK